MLKENAQVFFTADVQTPLFFDLLVTKKALG
jgi:hypothetical protein